MLPGSRDRAYLEIQQPKPETRKKLQRQEEGQHATAEVVGNVIIMCYDKVNCACVQRSVLIYDSGVTIIAGLDQCQFIHQLLTIRV
jgi:hypothetical protein